MGMIAVVLLFLAFVFAFAGAAAWENNRPSVTGGLFMAGASFFTFYLCLIQS